MQKVDFPHSSSFKRLIKPFEGRAEITEMSL